MALVFASSASATGFLGRDRGRPRKRRHRQVLRLPHRQIRPAPGDLAVCEVRGDGCKVAVWVTNGWAALVKKHSGLYIGGLGRTKGRGDPRDARGGEHEASSHLVATVFSGGG